MGRGATGFRPLDLLELFDDEELFLGKRLRLLQRVKRSVSESDEIVSSAAYLEVAYWMYFPFADLAVEGV